MSTVEQNHSVRLNTPELVEMRAALRRWAENLVHRDEFRAACIATADMIEAHLIGMGDDSKCAAAIEALYGRLAGAEIERIKRVEALDVAMCDAYEMGDVRAWLAALGEMLPLLSEAHAEDLMYHVAALGQSEDALVMECDLALVHPTPSTIQ
jgi:hypothetical protein